MISVTTTFDRVFDIAPGEARGKKHGTLFSFEHAGAIEYGVAIAGKPRLRPGMTVTALLRRPGDWQTLAGWVDHETGEIAGDSPWQPLGSISAALFLFIGALACWQRSPLASWGLVLVGGCITAVSIRHLLHIWTTRRQLRRAGWPGRHGGPHIG